MLDKLIEQPGEWLQGTGPEADVVISTRIRLARNLEGHPFPGQADAGARARVEHRIRETLQAPELARRVLYVNHSQTPPIDRQMLVERHLVSRELALTDGERGVALSPEERISIMVNEEDHLRVQCIRSGFQLDAAWEELDRIDDLLDRRLPYAFHPRFGYCTACPTNAGTGMRISVMLHLPALSIKKQVDKVLQALNRINFNVRSLYGEGTQATGDFYQISNQTSLGKAEGKILAELKDVVPEIVKFERDWRQALMADDRKKVEDRVWRSLGTLHTARVITSEETMERLSDLRLGVNLGVVKDVPIRVVNELFIRSQPGHLQKLSHRSLDAGERDIARADLLRRTLDQLQKPN